MKNTRTSYRTYKESSESPVDLKTYVKITNLFCKFIVAHLFLGYTIKLPARMGTLSVKGKKQKIKLDENGRLIGHAPDYKTTNELWEKCPECKERKQMVYHLNEHSNGIRYKFFWSKAKMFVAFKNFYSLVFTRTNKRLLSQLVQNGKEFYVEPSKY